MEPTQTADVQKAQELDIEISRVQREIISNARNKIATEMLILRLMTLNLRRCTASEPVSLTTL